MLDRYSDNEHSKRDIPSFIEPLPPLISNPFMRPRPQKGTNLLELFEEDSEIEEPELVQVYLRLKPYHAPNHLYEVRSDRCLITSVDTATAGHGRRTQHNVSKMYTFSHIFGAEATQKEVFENVVKGNLKKLPDGHNFTLLTYGASGSGKTYTLMGTVAAPGLVPRSLEYVFRVVDAAQHPVYKPIDGASVRLDYAEQDYELQWVKKLRHISAPLRDKYRRMSAGLCSDLTVSSMDLSNRTRHYVWVSFVEIYNEGIYDLLAPGDRRNAAKLRIREDATGNVYVKDVTQAFVRSGEEAYDVMAAGKHNLQVAATGVHAQSSRSHCIFTITMLTETDSGVRTSCVRLCDLAGCERARRTRNTGARMAESRAINSSLHVLERCLHTLRRARRAHPRAQPPYRESKLTRLLGAGLSGARGEAVSMVVTLNPAPEYAMETKHVLQLAAVARDIQINNTIAESTLESSTQDTTIGSSAEVMRLRADNERLHFELVQAQARNKELLAAMEEKQAEAATTMRELVDEAKDMTRQYYEAQAQALREEMEDMIEEYESRLSKANAAVKDPDTPSRSLQNKVAQLMTEIALLEEKLTAERLARARAEEEVQHLRACIDERDEKESENPPAKVVMMLSDSEQDSEEEVDDPCNESLEPTFKKEDINRSRLIANNLEQSSMQSDKTLDDSARSGDVTIENDTRNDSAVNTSEETVKDHDNTDTTKDSVYATGEEDSGTTNKTSDMHDSKNGSDTSEFLPENSNVSGKICKSEDESAIIKSFDDFNHPNSITDHGKKDSAPRGTYFIRSNAVEEDDDCNGSVNIKKPDSLTRGTYFVKEPHCKGPLCNSKTNDVDISKDLHKESLADSLLDEVPNLKAKVSDTLVNNIIKSMKSSQGRNTSLAQFEQLEMAAKICDDTKDKPKVSSGFGRVNVFKEKKTYFDESTSKEPMNKLEEADDVMLAPQVNKEKKTYFDNIGTNIEPAKRVNEVISEINLKIDDTRSPSIVKDEITNDFRPSAIKKLLGESFTRQPDVITSVHKNKVIAKKHDSVDMFEGLDSPLPVTKDIEKNDVVENARKSIEQLVLDQKSASKVKQEFKKERVTIAEESKEESYEISPVPTVDTPTKNKEPLAKAEEEVKNIDKQIIPENNARNTQSIQTQSQNVTVNNTIEEFENLYKDVSSSRATEFEMLVSHNATHNNEDKEPTHQPEETKYNLRHKSHKAENVKFADKVEKEIFDEVLMESNAKCESLRKPNNKRSLRLRRRKNQTEDSDHLASDQEGDKLKDIVNLQVEFSDVTMDVVAPVKVVNDIPSPEKTGEEENVAPLMGIQSCPSKSVTRSRRKLYTPRAEPLEEGSPGASGGRPYVPRPSYRRPRARRKL